jgi:hypothetical protein
MAGAAMREVHERARAADLTANDWKVLSVVVDYTAGWSKLVDGLTAETIAKAAGLSPRRTRDRLKKLDGLGIIRWTPRPGNPTFGGEMSEVSLPDAYADALSVRDGEPMRTPKSVHVNADDSTPPMRTPRASAHTEKDREDDVVVDERERLIDEIEFTASQRARALVEDRDRVLAWLTRAREPDVLNTAAFADSGIVGGGWPGPRAIEVRGTHGVSTQPEDDKPASAWNVYALNEDDTMVLVGCFDDRDEARRVYAEHDAKGGAAMEAVA